MIFVYFDKITDFSMTSQGTSLKARGLIFMIIAINIHIYTSVKTEFAKSIHNEDFKGVAGR